MDNTQFWSKTVFQKDSLEDAIDKLEPFDDDFGVDYDGRYYDCVYCLSVPECKPSQVKHNPDCPVLNLRKVLGGKKGE